MGSIIGGLIGALFSFLGATIAFKGKIHEESGWREKLLKLSSTELVSKAELLQLQSFVNPVKCTDKDDGKLIQDAKSLDNLINDFCIAKIEELDWQYYLPDDDSEHFRLLCKTLLKHDWINQTGSFWNKVEKQKKLFVKTYFIINGYNPTEVKSIKKIVKEPSQVLQILYITVDAFVICWLGILLLSKWHSRLFKLLTIHDAISLIIIVALLVISYFIVKLKKYNFGLFTAIAVVLCLVASIHCVKETGTIPLPQFLKSFP
ncbi:MAG TPA: hypothetical protein K8W06_01590 [Limosilactobacillus coleohominis]|nr:hypothetical protein [Limosilactobacillus coleohominis]